VVDLILSEVVVLFHDRFRFWYRVEVLKVRTPPVLKTLLALPLVRLALADLLFVSHYHFDMKCLGLNCGRLGSILGHFACNELLETYSLAVSLVCGVHLRQHSILIYAPVSKVEGLDIGQQL